MAETLTIAARLNSIYSRGSDEFEKKVFQFIPDIRGRRKVMEEMVIECIPGDGYVRPRSMYYSSTGVLSRLNYYAFYSGINQLTGDIDSGNWEVSYLLSMFKYRHKDFILLEKPVIIVNGTPSSLEGISGNTCYMDELYPLFSSNRTVKEQIIRGIKRSGSNLSCLEIIDHFKLDDQRFERPIKQTGNERFRAMAAIGTAYGKKLFCFPWFSRERFNGFHNNISGCLKMLENLGKIVVLPVGERYSESNEQKNDEVKSVVERSPDVEALIEFNGTKNRPVCSGYRPAHLVKDDYLTTGTHTYYSDEPIPPNGKTMGTITFITPGAYPHSLWIGKKVRIQEGERIVGYATITKIFNHLLQKTDSPD